MISKLKSMNFLKAGEFYVIAVCLIYLIIHIFTWNSYTSPFTLLLANLGIIAYTFLIAIIAEKVKIKSVQMLRLILLATATYGVYIITQDYLRAVNPHIYDWILIDWDRALFGNDLSKFFDGYRVPIVTEFLQLCYLSFYFLPMIHGVILYRSGKKDELYELYNVIIFGFLLSYLLYFIMPAIGPRFTLYDFKTLELDMPGVCLTDYARMFINAGGGAPVGVPNPAAVVNRDCMPSGHTMLTLVNMLLVRKYRTRGAAFFYVIGIGLIISTVYLRYHYGVDVLAGIVFAFVAIKLEPFIRKRLIQRDLVADKI